MAPAVPLEFAGQREFNNFSVMGKTRKVSKGYSCGFVPDYRHAVETVAESEGFGSSGRVNTDTIASGHSCAPKRRCISLNGDAYEHFGVPVEVLSLSKLSSFERKDLGLRLKHELEQVRIFQKKIASFSSNVVPMCDINNSRTEAVTDSHGKKRVAPPRNVGVRSKKPATGRSDPVKKALTLNSSKAMLMKQCETLLSRLMGHNFGWVFNTPVDVVALNIPDYYTVIKNPMDFGTVKTKLTSGKYVDPWGFAADVRLTFSNALMYNPRGHEVHNMAEAMSKFFEMRWKQIEKKLLMAEAALVHSKPNIPSEPEIAAPMSPLKKKNDVEQEPIKWAMSAVEKHKLTSELEALVAVLPESIIDFVKENSSNGNQTAEDEIEIDIDALSDDALFKLRKLLDDYYADKQKNVAKADTCEIELHNESGFSNSSVQPCKVNDPNDEDVDIGGNDLPISSFLPVEIEKDTAVKNSKCSSSSSSSSESGSSSSESDSGSSSGSESDGAKTSVMLNNAKETLGSEVVAEQQTSVPTATEAENYLVNGSSHVEQKSPCDPCSSEVDGRQEGESAPSERQVSPDKLYRAALLRSRFADTILKAQEKTIGKGEKQDPERLRLEKEELEKRRKEEKARLQAEAKAAEEARRRAEAEAAAEAKRKRELEREAARQALQKMEKTVDINENSRFLEDLGMLGVAPGEPLQSFIEETSPDHSQDVLGSFKFPGNGNPLEQLGLYIKEDDDEEEEAEPQVAGAPAVTDDDPEEGEID